eukprot:gene21443-27475_t
MWTNLSFATSWSQPPPTSGQRHSSPLQYALKSIGFFVLLLASFTVQVGATPTMAPSLQTLDHISTYAGAGSNGGTVSNGDNIRATSAALVGGPDGMCLDSSFNLYVAEITNRIRKVDASSGLATAFAGNLSAGSTGDGGPAASATIYKPYQVVADSTNLYVAFYDGNSVRSVGLSGSNIISTVGGTGLSAFNGDNQLATSANLNGPTGVQVANGTLYVLEFGSNRLRKIDGSTKLMTTIGGTGTASASTDSLANLIGDGGFATSATIWGGISLCLSLNKLRLYITDTNNNRIRVIDLTSKMITTVVGTGSSASSGDGGLATSASVWGPKGVALDHFGMMYVSEELASKVRRVDTASMLISTVVGTGTASGGSDSVNNLIGDGGPAVLATLSSPSFLFSSISDTTASVYVADKGNARVRVIFAVPSSNPTADPSDQPTMQPSLQPLGAPSSTPSRSQSPTMAPSSAAPF